jgi:hypothetical protein
MENLMQDIILERTFETINSNGQVKTLSLQFGRPYILTESKSSLMWRCPFRISGIGSERIQHGQGMDSLDALLVSLKLAELALTDYERNYNRKITWLQESHLGLSTIEFSNLSDADIQYRQHNIFEKAFEAFFKDFESRNVQSTQSGRRNNKPIGPLRPVKQWLYQIGQIFRRLFTK